MPSQDTAASLSAELQAKLVRRLQTDWEDINYTYFKDVLRRPIFALTDTRRCLGRWHAGARTLEISRTLVLEYPWAEVVEVLKHEVVHQFVDECLAVDEPPHGPTFRSICQRLGIDGRASGMPKKTGQEPASDRIVTRIRKLLALAESPNRHEAEAAATAARKLMLKFNIAVERQHSEGKRYGYRHLGEPKGRLFEHDRHLASLLTEYFFVDGIWIPVYRPREGKVGRVFEICGLRENLLMAEHVHAFLSGTAQRMWKMYKQKTGRSSNRDRQAFLAGVIRGFESKLASQRETFEEQGLVWVPGAELKQFFRRRYPKVQTVRRSGAKRNAAFVEGTRAGARIVLSQPVEASSTRGRRRALKQG